MEKVIVTTAFTGDDGKGGEKRFEKGEELTVTNDRAEHLRQQKLARKKPEAAAEKPATEEKADTASSA